MNDTLPGYCGSPVASLAEIDDAAVTPIEKPNRVVAPFTWFGGKGQLAPKILPLLPAGRIYVEPYAGAASLFWHLAEPRQVEVLNDVDAEIVNLFRVLQDADQFRELRHRLIWTPYSLDEFRRAIAVANDPHAMAIDRAWGFFARQNMGFCGKPNPTPGNWGRAFKASRKMGSVNAKWRCRIATLTAWHDRLTRVQLDHRDALQVIAYWDSPDTVFYVDPPYVGETRKTRAVYQHECDDEHHRRLVDHLLKIKGQAVVSGYDNQLYRPLLKAGWTHRRFNVTCSAAGRVRGSGLQGEGAASQKVPRCEVVWMKCQRTK
jgi:DNA adenine methylase